MGENGTIWFGPRRTLAALAMLSLSMETAAAQDQRQNCTLSDSDRQRVIAQAAEPLVKAKQDVDDMRARQLACGELIEGRLECVGRNAPTIKPTLLNFVAQTKAFIAEYDRICGHPVDVSDQPEFIRAMIGTRGAITDGPAPGEDDGLGGGTEIGGMPVDGPVPIDGPSPINGPGPVVDGPAPVDIPPDPFAPPPEGPGQVEPPDDGLPPPAPPDGGKPAPPPPTPGGDPVPPASGGEGPPGGPTPPASGGEPTPPDGPPRIDPVGPGPNTPPTPGNPEGLPVTDENVCGPDVTMQVVDVLQRMKRSFGGLRWGPQYVACKALIEFPTALDAWDIAQLGPPPEDAVPNISLHWLGNFHGQCAKPVDSVCVGTVTFLDSCQHAQVVNYAQWGAMKRLCQGFIENLKMGPLHRIRNALFRAVSYLPFTKSGAPPTDAQLNAAAFGYDLMVEVAKGVPDLTRLGQEFRDRDRNIDKPERECSLVCQLDVRSQRLLDAVEFDYHWTGVRN